MKILQSILLATDFRKSSEKAAEVTIRLAEQFDSHVTVLHVREQYITWPLSPFENQDLLSAKLTEHQIKLDDFQMHAGPPTEVIVNKCQELNSDLLIIGAGEKQQDDFLTTGPVAEMIIEQCEKPVLAVNPVGPELTFQTILCPVDHSEVSRYALQQAVQFARSFGSKLVVLSVVPDVSWVTAALATGHLDGAKKEHELMWIQEFEQYLQGLDMSGVNWEREIRHGHPHEQVTQSARQHGADLLIMGATGRSGLARVLLGSVTRRILRKLPCSILVIKDQQILERLYLKNLDRINQWMTEGREFLDQKVYPEAAAKFRQVIALDPYHASALDGLVQACEEMEQHDSAKQYRERSERTKR